MSFGSSAAPSDGASTAAPRSLGPSVISMKQTFTDFRRNAFLNQLTRDPNLGLTRISQLQHEASTQRFYSDKECKKKSRFNTRATRLLHSRVFYWTVNIFIFVTAVEMGIPRDMGHTTVRGAIDHSATAVFTVEMLLKSLVMRHHYVKDPWNVLDCIVTITSIMYAWIIPLAGSSTGRQLGVMKILRIFRICRVMRFVGVVHELKVLMEGLLSSISALVWVVLLLLILLYAFGIVFVEVLGSEDYYPGYSRDTSMIRQSPKLLKFNNFEYFGTLERSMMTLFNVALLTDWAPLRPVFEFQIWCLPLFFLLIFLTSFAIVNVIIGVIVERTTRLMEEAHEKEMEAFRERQIESLTSMADTLWECDDNGDGKLSMEEMRTLDVSTCAFFEDLNFPKGFTTDDLFIMLNLDGNGDLTKQEFVDGMDRLIFSDEFQTTCLEHLGQGRIKMVHQDLHKVQSQFMNSEFTFINNQMKILFEEIRQLRFVMDPAAKSTQVIWPPRTPHDFSAVAESQGRRISTRKHNGRGLRTSCSFESLLTAGSFPTETTSDSKSFGVHWREGPDSIACSALDFRKEPAKSSPVAEHFTEPVTQLTVALPQQAKLTGNTADAPLKPKLSLQPLRPGQDRSPSPPPLSPVGPRREPLDAELGQPDADTVPRTPPRGRSPHSIGRNTSRDPGASDSSLSSLAGATVSSGGRVGTVQFDGRPDQKFATVVWQGGCSEVMPVSLLKVDELPGSADICIQNLRV